MHSESADFRTLQLLCKSYRPFSGLLGVAQVCAAESSEFPLLQDVLMGLLHGRSVTCPWHVHQFLCPLPGVRPPTDSELPLVLWQCDPVRVVVLTRIVLPRAEDVSHVTYTLAAALAVRACWLQEQALVPGLAAPGPSHPFCDLVTPPEGSPVPAPSPSLSSDAHTDAALGAIRALKPSLDALGLVLELIMPPTSPAHPTPVPGSSAAPSSLRAWATAVITASSSIDVAALLAAHGVSPVAVAAMVASSSVTPLFTAQRIPSTTVTLYDAPVVGLLRLPSQYDLLFGKLWSIPCAACGTRPETPALCLVCGTMLCGGSDCCKVGDVGECTRHAALYGGSTCAFLLVNSSEILLVRGRFSATYPSPFLDVHGEEDHGLKRHRPLHLNRARYQALQQLWASHQISREVTTLRVDGERYIHANWY